MTPTGGPRRCAAGIASDPAPQVAVNPPDPETGMWPCGVYRRPVRAAGSALAGIPGHGVGLYGVPLT